MAEKLKRKTRSPFRNWSKVGNIGALHHHRRNCFKSRRDRNVFNSNTNRHSVTIWERLFSSKEAMQNPGQISRLSSSAFEVESSTENDNIVFTQQSNRLLYFTATLSTALIVISVMVGVLYYTMKQRGCFAEDDEDSGIEETTEDDEDDCEREENATPNNEYPSVSWPSIQKEGEYNSEAVSTNELQETDNNRKLTILYALIRNHIVNILLTMQGKPVNDIVRDDCNVIRSGKETLRAHRDLQDVNLDCTTEPVAPSDAKEMKLQTWKLEEETNRNYGKESQVYLLNQEHNNDSCLSTV